MTRGNSVDSEDKWGRGTQRTRQGGAGDGTEGGEGSFERKSATEEVWRESKAGVVAVADWKGVRGGEDAVDISVSWGCWLGLN